MNIFCIQLGIGSGDFRENRPAACLLRLLKIGIKRTEIRQFWFFEFLTSWERILDKNNFGARKYIIHTS